MRQNRNRVSNSTRQKAVVKETFQRHKAKKNTEPTATMVGKAKENFFSNKGVISIPFAIHR